MKDIELRLASLEHQQRTYQLMVSVLIIMLAAALAFHSPTTVTAKSPGDVLRAKGLIIEDESGHARIVMGSPTPFIPGRRRAEPVDGILLLGANGTDRMIIAYNGPPPQVGGKVIRRSSPASIGFLMNDQDGDERAGMGVSDDGNRTSLAMDYSDRDALGMLVSPTFSGFVGFARTGEHNDQFALAVTKNGDANFKLAGNDGEEKVIAEARTGAGLKLQVHNPKTKKLEDVSDRIFP